MDDGLERVPCCCAAGRCSFSWLLATATLFAFLVVFVVCPADVAPKVPPETVPALPPEEEFPPLAIYVPCLLSPSPSLLDLVDPCDLGTVVPPEPEPRGP